MSVLICKNVETEDPGTIKDYLRMNSTPYTIVELAKGENIPEPDGFDTLIMMGGPMSVNEGETYPYIKEEEKLVRNFISKDKKILGICLGAQIMAKALGARVYMGTEKEIGWYDIELTDEGLNDPRMRNLALHPENSGDLSRRVQVFHWHGETFNIPAYAVRLAESQLYPNQAFRYGNNAYAFQFHIEVSKEMIYEWFGDESVDMDRLKDESERFYDVYRRRAFKFYELFFNKV